MRWRAALASGVWLFSSACSRLTTTGTPRPDSLDDFRACWLPGHSASEEKDPSSDQSTHWLPRLSSPQRAALVLETRWGESLIRTEYVFIELLIDAPHPVSQGDRFEVGGPGVALFSEGSQGGVERRQARGSVAVLDRSADRLTLSLDLEVSPGRSRPQERWRGQVQARIQQDPGACYR